MHEAGLHREKRAGRFLASVSIAGCPGKTSGNGILIPLKFASVSDADGASLKATVCVAERGEWPEPVHDLAAVNPHQKQEQIRRPDMPFSPVCTRTQCYK